MTTTETEKSRAALKDRTPGVSVRRRYMRAPSKIGDSRSFIVFGVAIIIMLGIASILLQLQPDSHPAPPGAADANRHNVGTITLAPEGVYCRQLALDNRSGDLVEAGRIKCIGPGSVEPEQPMQDRYSGGRIEAIRKSFSGGR
jgi:hypothetical protein